MVLCFTIIYFKHGMEGLVRPKSAVHFCLQGPNDFYFPICGTLHRGCLQITEFVGKVTCSDCQACLVEAAVLPDPGHHGRKRLKHDGDDSGLPDFDAVGVTPSSVLATLHIDDGLLDFH